MSWGQLSYIVKHKMNGTYFMILLPKNVVFFFCKYIMASMFKIIPERVRKNKQNPFPKIWYIPNNLKWDSSCV